MAFIRNVDKLIEGLENKFFTEQRAKDALAPELAAEEAAREAGDSAEAAARQSADNALSGRLDVIEGSGEGSVAKAEQDAKDYADQKVAALVNSAPEVLDTLKELSDALGGDENFATTVANNIGAVDAKVDQEILDRQSAVSAEQSARQSADQALDGRLDLLEADSVTKAYVDGEVSVLQGQITQEISDRQSAVEAEEDARQLADSNLSDRIGVLEQDPTTKAYVDGEVSDLQGQITQEISDRQSAVSSEQSRAQSAEQALDGRLDILEQDPTTKSYVDGEVLDLQGQITQEISDRQSDVNAEESRAMSAEQGLQSDIDAEEVRAMAAESALDSRIDVLEQDPTTKAYVDGKVVMLQGEVDSEESRAMSAEQALDGRLDVLEQDPTTKTYVDSEVSDLQGQITQEIADRQSAVSTEQSRAVAAEEALDARLDVLEADPVTKSYVDSQDSGLQGQINTEKGRIDAILSASEADKDSFAEIVQLINSVDTENDSAFASYVLSNDAALAQEISDRQADVNAEEQRAMAAEGLLDGRLDVLESDPTTKTYVDSEVSAEESRAITAEALLAGRLDVLEEDPTTKTYVDNEVSAEAAARSAEDLTMFKKDGSRQLTGSIIPNVHGTLDLGSEAIKFNSIFAGNGNFEGGINGGSANFWGNITMQANNSLLWATDGAANIGASGANRPNNIYVKNSIENTGSYLASASFTGQTGYRFLGATNSGFSYDVASSTLRCQVNNAAKLEMGNAHVTASAPLRISGANNFLWITDGAGDIGASTANRPNNVYAKTLVVSPTVNCNIITGGLGNLYINAGQKIKGLAKANDYTLTASDYLILVMDLSVSRTMTLPNANQANTVFIIKDRTGAASATNYIRILPVSGQLIDGQSDYKITVPYESVMIYSDSLNWYII